MLELRTNVVLDTEKIKTWMEAQAQLEALPMRQLFGILKKLLGCRRGATSAERAADIVRWLQTEKWTTREGSHAEALIRRRRRIYGFGVLLLWLIFRVHVWSVDHGPRETCRILVSRTSELGSASSESSQNFVLGQSWVHLLARRMGGYPCTRVRERRVPHYHWNDCASVGVCPDRKTWSDQTWLCVCVPRVGWRRSHYPHGLR